MIRIGLLTSGGDCQALNAAMRGVAKGLLNSDQDVELYGFLDGYKGLIYGNYKTLAFSDFSGILTKGGTILGSSRCPFKNMRDPDENGLDKVAAMKQNYYKLNLNCLVILGGNGTHKTANLLREEGLNIVTLPKTIDNDLWGTDMTFGFQSAVDIATQCIDQIHTTAASHGRVFIVEVMGHKVGFLTLNAGMAGGADIILIPEIPYDIDKVIEAIREEADLQFLQWQRALFPRKKPNCPKRNIRNPWKSTNIQVFLMKLQTRLPRRQVWKSELLFPDIHKEVEALILTTEYLQADWVQKLHA